MGCLLVILCLICFAINPLLGIFAILCIIAIHMLKE